MSKLNSTTTTKLATETTDDASRNRKKKDNRESHISSSISRNTSLNRSSSDAFAVMASANSNISRFGKTVTATASTLVSSSQYSDLSGTYYHETMKDLVRKPAFQKRLFSFSRRAPSEVVRSTLSSKDDIKFRAITAIPEELFSQLPTSNNQFSLFQGFQATTATTVINTDIENLRAKTITDGQPASKPTRKKLLKERDQIYNTLDLLEIRKDLAANEINEIDQKIAYLQANRSVVFERVATLEQEEFQLENKVRHISMQIDMLSEEDDDEEEDDEDNSSEFKGKSNKGGKDSTKESKNTSESKKSNNTLKSTTAKASKSSLNGSGKQNDPTDSLDSAELSNELGEDGEPLLSQSIFGKLQSSHDPKSTSVTSTSNKQKFHRQSSSLRKTQPTLQQYYNTGDSIKTIRAHNDTVTCLDFDIPFGTMVSASVDDTCKVWDLGRGICKGQLRGHNAYVTCLHMENNLVVTGSMDATVRLWDLSQMEFEDPEDNSSNLNSSNEDFFIQVFESHLREITALHFYQDTLVTGSADKTIRQWDLRSGRCLQTLDVLWAAAQSSTAQFTETSNWRQQSPYSSNNKKSNNTAPFVGALQCFDAALASGTADGVVRLWDLRSGQVQRSLFGHTGPVTCLQFDDVYLTTGSMDRSIRMWDLRTGSIVDAFAYDSPISSLHFDSRKIVSTNNENTVKIYDRETGNHWTCGPGVYDENSPDSIKLATFKEGYLVEGRENGIIGTWAC